MPISTHSSQVALMLCSAITLAGCVNSSVSSTEQKKAAKGMDLSLFADGAFTQEPEIVDCETAEGTATTCYKFVTSGAPAGRMPGPFCPRTINDGAEMGGVWFDKAGTGELVDITGSFIADLSSYYDDEQWQLYDASSGLVRYTATEAACLGAAKPNVEEQYRQNCIECELAYLEDDFYQTFLIPTTPIPAASPGRVHTAGIALDGAELSGPAPVDAILGAYTIAAFDDCGGHINVHQGYHYHAANGCTNTFEGDDEQASLHAPLHAPLIGYASDGYGIYAMENPNGVEETLDECRGSTDDIRGYHYHAASPSENMFIACLHGESVRQANGPAGGPPPGGRPPEGRPPEGAPPPGAPEEPPAAG